MAVGFVSQGEKKKFSYFEGEHPGLRPEEVIKKAIQFLLSLEKELAQDEARRDVQSELRGFRGPKIEKTRRDTFDRLLSLKDSPRSSFIEVSKVTKQKPEDDHSESQHSKCDEMRDIPQEGRHTSSNIPPQDNTRHNLNAN